MKLQDLLLPIFSTLLILPSFVVGTHKCVWVRGAVQCKKDPSKQLNVEVRVIDRDGISILKMIDPDDLMGVTFTEADGTFQLDGCGDDFNWLPGVPNIPDPFIRIFHYCNDPKGETIELPEFDTFVPQTHDIGVLVLDDYETVKTAGNRKIGENAGSISTATNSRPSEELPVVVSLPSGDSDAPISSSARPPTIGKRRDNEKYVFVTKPDSDGETLVPNKPEDEVLIHQEGLQE